MILGTGPFPSYHPIGGASQLSKLVVLILYPRYTWNIPSEIRITNHLLTEMHIQVVIHVFISSTWSVRNLFVLGITWRFETAKMGVSQNAVYTEIAI